MCAMLTEIRLFIWFRELGIDLEAMEVPSEGDFSEEDAQKKLIQQLEDAFYLYDYKSGKDDPENISENDASSADARDD